MCFCTHVRKFVIIYWSRKSYKENVQNAAALLSPTHQKAQKHHANFPTFINPWSKKFMQIVLLNSLLTLQLHPLNAYHLLLHVFRVLLLSLAVYHIITDNSRAPYPKPPAVTRSLSLGWGSHDQLWRYMLIFRQVNEICRYILHILLRWMPSPRCSSGLISADCVNLRLCCRCLLQLWMSGSMHFRLPPEPPSQHRVVLSSCLSLSCLLYWWRKHRLLPLLGMKWCIRLAIFHS